MRLRLPRRLRCWLGNHGFDAIRVTNRFVLDGTLIAQVHEQRCLYCPKKREYLNTGLRFMRIR